MSASRTENTVKNAGASLAAQGITAILQFVSRRIFIIALGNAYLSLDGLFSNILTMLSLAELGFGEAIVFCLYKPLATKDNLQTKALMDFYKRVYQIVAAVILVLGICVIPLFPFIMKDAPDIPENLKFIYLMFLANTVVSYLWVHKQSILIADQKNYVVYNAKMVISIFTMCVQIVLLLLTHNYLLYLAVTIATTIGTNLFVSIQADKRYPFIKDKGKTSLDTETKKTISINVRALILYKVGTMLVTGVDNLLISSMIGVLSVGLYSNYSLIVNKAGMILRSIVSSATGSVGNLNVLTDVKSKESVARRMLFATFWIFGFAASGMFNLVNHFMYYFAGKEYLLNNWVVLFIVLDFYLLGVITPMSVFRNAMGLYRYGKLRPMACAVANLIVSILLVKPFGLIGIVMGTFVARFCITSWYEPYMVFRYGLKMSSKGYLIRYGLYMLVVLAVSGLCYLCCLPWAEYTIANFIIKIVVVSVVTNGLFFVIFRKTDEFVEMYNTTKGLVNKLLKRFKK